MLTASWAIAGTRITIYNVLDYVKRLIYPTSNSLTTTILNSVTRFKAASFANASLILIILLLTNLPDVHLLHV